MNRLIVVLFVGLGILAGCSSTPMVGEEQSHAPVEDRSGAQAGGVAPPPVTAINAGAGGAGAGFAALRDPNNILSKRSVFFDYDSFVVKEEFRPLVEAHAKFLLANPTAKMLIQGNTDDRGSREYNIALGQKRADAVRKLLSLLGVKDEQVESVSLGEEKPRNPGHDEAAWAENRRSDILYTGEY